MNERTLVWGLERDNFNRKEGRHGINESEPVNRTAAAFEECRQPRKKEREGTVVVIV